MNHYDITALQMYIIFNLPFSKMEIIRANISLLTEKYDGVHLPVSDISFCQYFFENYNSVLQSLPKDLLEFMDAYPYLQIRGWTFRGISGLNYEKWVCIGGNYLGLGHRLMYVFDKDDNKIKLITENHYVYKQYDRWEEALKELIYNEFDWEFIYRLSHHDTS